MSLYSQALSILKGRGLYKGRAMYTRNNKKFGSGGILKFAYHSLKAGLPPQMSTKIVMITQ